MHCPNCGGHMHGDGVTEPYHCERIERPDDVEPDANPVYCTEDAMENKTDAEANGTRLQALPRRGRGCVMQLVRFLGDGAEVSECDPTVLHAENECGDHTLCGTTMDGDLDTAGSCEPVEGNFVTCPRCIRIIKYCKTLRYRSKAHDAGQEGGA